MGDWPKFQKKYGLSDRWRLNLLNKGIPGTYAHKLAGEAAKKSSVLVKQLSAITTLQREQIHYQKTLSEIRGLAREARDIRGNDDVVGIPGGDIDRVDEILKRIHTLSLVQAGAWSPDKYDDEGALRDE